MVRDPITKLLAVALLLSVTVTAALGYWYLHATAQNQEAQREVARVNANRALMQPLAAECVEYARKHTNFIPVLNSLGLRLRIDTNAPSAK
jgi:hypothetical protein